MRSLRDLLTTWENWSARDTLTRALGRVSSDDAREALQRGLAETPEVDPLDALRDAAELVSLLSGWQWQAVHAARRAHASWEDVARATGTTAEEARTSYVAAIERQERYGISSTEDYRAVL